MSITVSENSNGGNSKNVKDMLRAGASPDELLSRLQEEINSAQEELEAEAALTHNYTKEDIEELRSILVEDALEYFEALGVLKAIPDLTMMKRKITTSFTRFYMKLLRMRNRRFRFMQLLLHLG